LYGKKKKIQWQFFFKNFQFMKKRNEEPTTAYSCFNFICGNSAKISQKKNVKNLNVKKPH
jgi:hypothetical protein